MFKLPFTIEIWTHVCMYVRAYMSQFMDKLNFSSGLNYANN